MVPSSKVTVGFVVGLVVALVQYGANLAGLEVATIDPADAPGVLFTLLLAAGAAWLKPENRPSKSAVETLQERAQGR